MQITPAILVLEDGTLFHGKSIGVSGETVGEVVFNTAMTGYQEILSDPSYAHQIVTLTAPHIGNIGTNNQDNEGSRPWASGLVIRNLSRITSNWRSQISLTDYLIQHNIVGIADIDTRQLTRHLRETGALRGCILAGEQADENAALEKARAFAGLDKADLAQIVTTQEIYTWDEGTPPTFRGVTRKDPPQGRDTHQDNVERKSNGDTERTASETDPFARQAFNVVVYDYGVKSNILRLLVDHGCKLTVVPAKTPVEDVLAMNPDGVFLSNGPGDPAACDYAIAATRALLDKNMPLFGICLGCQLLALACDGNTVKMKFGHHGANHPVQDLTTKKVSITSQNHGFAVEEDTLPKNLQVTHRSLFDQSIQGIRHTEKPAFGFQGHPEASPGPHDIIPLFNTFIELMKNAKA